MKQLIAQGAEAKLFLEDNEVIKDRFKKSYRIAEIDDRLRRSRTRREAKILEKLKAINFPCPLLINSDDKESLKMEYIKGKKVGDILENSNYTQLSEEIGKKIATLHNSTIIHGDLTTSNMLLSNQVYFIDFGLSFFSHKTEDMAVDLHLLKQALESKHYRIWEKCFNAAMKAYQKESAKGKEVLNRLKVVESRGRYKRRK